MKSYLINPEEDEDEAVLFEADENGDLDYEENPRKNRRRKGKGKKRGAKRRRRHGKKKVIKLVEVPKRRRRRRKASKRRRKAGKKQKAAKRRRRTTPKAMKRLMKGAGVKTEQNPRRRRRRRKSRKVKKAPRRRRRKARKAKAPKRRRRHSRRRRVAEANYWPGQPRRHRKAAKKAWRRRRRKGYEANPRRRRRRVSKPWRATVYKSNPAMGILNPFKGAWTQLKAHPVKGCIVLVVGMIDTGLIQMGMNMALQKVNIPEPAKDVARIVTSAVGGSIISFAVGKITKNAAYGQIHQVGVYASTILDSVGTAIKYILRATAKQQYKLPGPVPQPVTPASVAAGMFGLGSIMGVLNESKLIQALSADGLVVAKGDDGQLALAHAGTGEIVLSGPADSMKPVIKAVSGISFQQKGNDLGEDITVES